MPKIKSKLLDASQSDQDFKWHQAYQVYNIRRYTRIYDLK